MAKENKKRASLLVFALVFLFNPNIQIVDLMPDFVSFFIFARLLEKPALKAPYFDEARSSAFKLAFISLAKIPAFILAILIRSKNTVDNDVFALFALVFACLEIIYSISFINNLASGFFHLGERGSASALISPFPLSKKDTKKTRPEDLKSLTIIFVVAKSVLFTAPEFLLLTGTGVNGTLTPAPLARFYPRVLLLALALGFLIGAVWLHRSIRYLKVVLDEGEFTKSLDFLKSENSDAEYEIKLKLRTTNRGFFAIALATVFTIPLSLQETEQINIFPGFLFGLIFLYALLKLSPFSAKAKLKTFISGIVYVAFSVFAFIFSASFLTEYDYIDLLNRFSASYVTIKKSYLAVVITAGLEFLALAVFLFFSFTYLYSFITENTGLSPTSKRYSKTEREYHSSLKKRLYIFVGMGLFTSLLKFINTTLFFRPQTNFSKVDGVLTTITSSAVPWFGVLVMFSSIFFIGYTIYFMKVMREEVEMKCKKL